MGSYLSTPTLTKEEMSKIEQLVEEIINSNKVAVFSKSYCRKVFYCL